MHRADLGCVWGNVLLPIVLAGDVHQLLSVTMMGEADSQGNLYNRLGKDGAILPLAFFGGEWAAPCIGCRCSQLEIKLYLLFVFVTSFCNKSND